jgi:hypothetical protein
VVACAWTHGKKAMRRQDERARFFLSMTIRPASTAAPTSSQMNDVLLSLLRSASAIVVPEVPVVPVPVGMPVSMGAVPVVAAGTSDCTLPGGAGIGVFPLSVCATATLHKSAVNTTAMKYLILVLPL